MTAIGIRPPATATDAAIAGAPARGDDTVVGAVIAEDGAVVGCDSSMATVEGGGGDTDAALSVALPVQPPSRTGSALYDALIAALVEHRLVERSLPLPAWVHEEARSLPRLTPLLDEPWYRDLGEATSPPAFRKHGVLIARGELESV